MGPQSNHPLTEAEREIAKFVVRRFIERDELTTETDLMIALKQYRAIISESLRKLVDRSVLHVVNNTYTEETYAPRAIAFHYCGDTESLKFAKESTELIFKVVSNIVERELDSGSKDQFKEFKRENALAEAKTIDPNATPETVRVGLALAEEFSLFYGLNRPSHQFGIVTFRPSRRIFQIDPANAWDKHILRCGVWLEREPEGKSADHVAMDQAGWPIEVEAAEIEMNKVFVVHGHAEELKLAVAAFLRSGGLEPIILHEQPNEGKTIIEKFEKHSKVGFAVVLLTPDDWGGPAGQPERMRSRARQNVILELGYFMKAVGRGKVCCLYVDGVELPSDYNGVLYIPYDSRGDWRQQLSKELNAAGILFASQPAPRVEDTVLRMSAAFDRAKRASRKDMA